MGNDSNPAGMCPFCGLDGREAMIPDGSGEPRIERGIQYACGTTTHRQSSTCALIEKRITALRAELAEATRKLARFDDCRACDECGATDSIMVVQGRRMRKERDALRAELAEANRQHCEMTASLFASFRTHDDLRTELAEVKAERDAETRRADDNDDARKKAEAERDAMRDVVDAAEFCRDASQFAVGEASRMLDAAVDTLRAAQQETADA